jgi:hypothetical protein
LVDGRKGTALLGARYTEKRLGLKQIRDSLREELHRMGVVT